MVVVLSYANSFQCGFGYDNKLLILDDARVHRVSLENLKFILTESVTWPSPPPSNYRPLTTLSFLLNYAVFGNGDQPASYHAVNLALHWLNASLVYGLVWLLTRRRGPAFFAAALFGVHPVATESATNIIERSGLMSAAAVLGGLLLHIRGATAPEAERPRWLLRLGLVTTLGLFCKENAAVLIAVIALYDFTYRVQPKHPQWLANLAVNFWDFFKRGYVVLLLPIVGFFMARAWVLGKHAALQDPVALYPLAAADFWTVRLTALKVIGNYLGLLAWPQTLCHEYRFAAVPLVSWPLRTWEDWKAPLALAAMAALLALAVACYRRQKAVFFFVVFFLGTLLPMSNLLANPVVPLTQVMMAERYLYLPSVGFAACIALAAYGLADRLQSRQGISNNRRRLWGSVLPAILLGSLVAACGVRTWVRNCDWRDEQTLWRAACRAYPDSFRNLLYGAPQDDPAVQDRIIELLEKLAALAPNKIQPRWLLGERCRLKGDRLAAGEAGGARVAQSSWWYQKAVDALAPAVRIEREWNEQQRQKQMRRGKPPEQVENVPIQAFYAELGLCYLRLGKHAEAAGIFDYRCARAPRNPQAWLDLATAQQGMGRIGDAALSLVEAMLVGDDASEAWVRLNQLAKEAAP